MKEADNILEFIYYNQHKPLSTAEIAEQTDLPPAKVEKALNELEENYLINIGIKADSAHYQDITITADGERSVESDFFLTADISPDVDIVPWDAGRKA